MNAITRQKEGEVARQAQSTENPCLAPPVNIYEGKESYILEAEMPGVEKAGLEITLEGNVLTLVGRRQDPAPAKAELLHRESNPADYRRVFELDPAVDASKIGAKMDQGVLTLTLPKAEKAKPQRIQVGE